MNFRWLVTHFVSKEKIKIKIISPYQIPIQEPNNLFFYSSYFVLTRNQINNNSCSTLITNGGRFIKLLSFQLKLEGDWNVESTRIPATLPLLKKHT